MSDEWTILFDGTDRCPMGRLFNPPSVPAPVTPRYVLPMDTAPPAPPKVKAWRPRRCGAVFAAKDRLWTLLEFPRTARDLFEALSLPENAVSSLLSRAVKDGVLTHAGSRLNEARERGVRHWSQLYRRAPRYAHVTTWPIKDTHITRTQRRSRAA